MANLLSAIAQGFRGAGAAMSPEVYNTQRQEEQLQLQRDEKKKELILGLMIKAVESGSMAPEVFQQHAPKLGFGGIPQMGPGMDAQLNQVKLAEARAQAEMRAGRGPAQSQLFTPQYDPESVRAATAISDGNSEEFDATLRDHGKAVDPRQNPDAWDSYASNREQAQDFEEADRARKIADSLRKRTAPEIKEFGGKPYAVKPTGDGFDVSAIPGDFTKPESPYGKVNPSDFTPESIRAFDASGGKDFSLLKVDPRQTRAAGASNTNFIQEKEESKAVGAGLGKRYLDIQEAARLSKRRADRYDRLNELLDGVETGKLTPIGTEIAAFAESLGIKIDPKLGNKQAAVALGNEVALELRNPSGGAGMPGALSDKDLAFLMTMRPGLATSPDGRRLMSETVKKLAQRDMEVARMARAYRKKHGQLDEGFEDELDDFSSKNQLFKGMKPVSPVEVKPANGVNWTVEEERRLKEIERVLNP